MYNAMEDVKRKMILLRGSKSKLDPVTPIFNAELRKDYYLDIIHRREQLAVLKFTYKLNCKKLDSDYLKLLKDEGSDIFDSVTDSLKHLKRKEVLKLVDKMYPGSQFDLNSKCLIFLERNSIQREYQRNKGAKVVNDKILIAMKKELKSGDYKIFEGLELKPKKSRKRTYAEYALTYSDTSEVDTPQAEDLAQSIIIDDVY
jgi:hypothetical protein